MKHMQPFGSDRFSRFKLFSLVSCIFALLVLVSCKPKVPSGILSESDVESILYDYHLAQCAAETDGGNVDSLRYLYVQAVFKKHEITEDEFDKTMDWYCSNSEKLQEIYQHINARMVAESSALGVGATEIERMANLSQTGDTANVWPFELVVFIHNDPTQCLRTFTIAADNSFKPGDRFQLSFRSHFITQGSSLAYAFLTVNFVDGTSASSFYRITYEGDIMLTLPDDAIKPDLLASRISVTLYYPSADTHNDASYFYITTPALVRIHQKPVENVAKKDSTEEEMPKVVVQHDSAHTTIDRCQPRDLIQHAPVEREIDIVKEKKYAPQRKRRRRAH